MVPKVTERIYGLDKKMIVIVLAYFSYSQCQTTEGDGTTAGMWMLNIYGLDKKMVVIVPAYLNYFQCQIKGGCRVHLEIVRVAKHQGSRGG